MCVTDDGSLLVALAGSDEVLRQPLIAGAAPQRVFRVDEYLRAPHGVGSLGGGVWCVSSPADGKIAVFDQDGEVKQLYRLAPPDDRLAQLDPDALLRRHGEHAFYEATRSGISCQSCHLHADSDYSRHRIGYDMYSTLSVRGVTGTSPYLRDGSYSRLRDLHEIAEELFGNYMRSSPVDRGLALEAFMKGLSLRVNPHSLGPADIERERVGVAAFVKASCVECHSFPHFTSLNQHPENFLFPKHQRYRRRILDVPSLRAIALSAPYLHDGRAKSLDDVLRQENEANLHGNVAALSDEEREALIYFLRTL